MSLTGDERRASLSDVSTTVASSPVEPTFKCPFASTRQQSETSLIYEDLPAHHYYYHHPRKTDVRGPCPALNTLANHGYINRDGKNITPKMLLEALQRPDTYHCTAPLARVLVWGGFFLLRKHRFGKLPKSISLHDLALHNRIEHNASVVHLNTPDGEKYAPIDVDVDLLERFIIGKNEMTIEEIADRRMTLEVASPLDWKHSEIARGEWSLVLGIFGNANKGRINSAELKDWLQENRFERDWKPSHRQTLIHTVATSFKIRGKMNKSRKGYLKKKCEHRENTINKEELEGEKNEKFGTLSTTYHA